MADEAGQIIERMASGDRAALQDLYKLTSSTLFGILMRILRHKPDAEDALQNVYIKAWRFAPRYQPDRNGMSWLATIARNHAIDVIRSRDRRRTSELEPEELVDTTMGAADRTMLREDLRNCLGQLPERHAGVVLQVYMRGLSYVEVAELTDSPVNTIRTWLRRSLLQLRECLGGGDGH